MKYVLGVMAIASALSSSIAVADNHEITPDKAALAKAFDKAVREEATIDNLAGLPWDAAAMIYRPEVLASLKYCDAPSVTVYKDTMTLEWMPNANSENRCGQFGYLAFLVLKNGRIKRLSFQDVNIVVTSR